MRSQSVVSQKCTSQLDITFSVTLSFMPKAGFHVIANDRKRELFPYNCRRSQTIAELTEAILFVQRKCQMYSCAVLTGKSKQTTWLTPGRKFCCKQIYLVVKNIGIRKRLFDRSTVIIKQSEDKNFHKY